MDARRSPPAPRDASPSTASTVARHRAVGGSAGVAAVLPGLLSVIRSRSPRRSRSAPSSSNPADVRLAYCGRCWSLPTNSSPSLPYRWDTVLSRRLHRRHRICPPRQWQRLASTRAVYAVRALCLASSFLYEPTANLDVLREAELFDRFLDLSRRATTIFFSHRFSTVLHANRIVFLDHGQSCSRRRLWPRTATG